MKVKIPHLHYMSDWTVQKVNEIETDDYLYFRIENRGSSVGDWCILGYNKKNQREDILTGHGCYLSDVVEFYHNHKNKVRRINILHFHEKNNSLVVFFKAYESYMNKVSC